MTTKYKKPADGTKLFGSPQKLPTKCKTYFLTKTAVPEATSICIEPVELSTT
jgi:hypothetical protein